MTIAIIGRGNIGSGLAGALRQAGHQVDALDRGDDLRAGVAAAEIVILATPFDAATEIAASADFVGKLVIDLSNPVTADFSALQLGHDTSAAERIAALLPGASVVKAFNTIFAGHYATGLQVDGLPLQTYVASDNEAARDSVKALAGTIGLVAIDAGPLQNARYLEPLGFLNIQFGYVLGQGTGIAPQWLGVA